MKKFLSVLFCMLCLIPISSCSNELGPPSKYSIFVCHQNELFTNADGETITISDFYMTQKIRLSSGEIGTGTFLIVKCDYEFEKLNYADPVLIPTGVLNKMKADAEWMKRLYPDFDFDSDAAQSFHGNFYFVFQPDEYHFSQFAEEIKQANWVDFQLDLPGLWDPDANQSYAELNTEKIQTPEILEIE